ncbi:tRNA (adenosine(37)-N6)-threonylcarbamoyltransferase complex dimerization subunit type 1 TsaB [Alloacidobacterium dinghuense]|uniref:tRNA (Adenosine(37)-N6)-threonylcarbamoyltransferase complex dimerization subunit type 1 TsaB n=1 Tax=Alloacidobacterium dinghuense TaxID=2763107 RepID=A0A7G8BJC2_9BACT|nr:tRNA (adenosine(37)-N6)-threonylcarbamoyltransferase complex dimerization subunit type 1 TsaB [Alloacidobacterium dinghuense]QNI32642.1 tRNA (adenosine(37)-N6)-threonylcarbamoyltransferase complex dimerization subunit type 1 TsaB [Alloacidobacterium dinghuense]
MLLAIDTCGNTGTIALALREGESMMVIGTAELAGKTYSAMLVPRLRELFEAHHVDRQHIEAIVVVNGPGSFTGVRVGLSAVKGLAEVLATPIIAVSRLQVLAHKEQKRFAALDAGRGEFYFRDDNPGAPSEALLTLGELRDAAPAASELVVCEEKVAAAFPEACLVTAPTATDALAVALPRLRAGDFDDLASLDGNYLRRSDAELFARKPEAVAGKTQSA